MTKVKICGLKEIDNLNVAVEAGVDAIGFVFAESKRQISIEKATLLAKHVPDHILKIGVFVNAPAELILKAFQEVPLDFVQYHGTESNEEIKKIGVPSIKACSVQSEEDIQKALIYNVDYLLLDAPGIQFAGGSGKTFNWNLLNNPVLKKRKFILAGGLNPANVKNAIDIALPYMIDVSSGVEKNGIKNNDLIQRFINAVKGECSLNDEKTK